MDNDSPDHFLGGAENELRPILWRISEQVVSGNDLRFSFRQCGGKFGWLLMFFGLAG